MLSWQWYEKCSGLAGGEDRVPPQLVTAPRLQLRFLPPAPSRALPQNRGVCACEGRSRWREEGKGRAVTLALVKHFLHV